MTKFVTLTLCLLFAMTFNAIAQETSDAQSPEMQIPSPVKRKCRKNAESLSKFKLETKR